MLPNSDEVAKMAMDKGTLQHLKIVHRGGINLQGVLHMYSGNGDACYAENSDRQRNVFHVLQPVFEAALQKLAFPKEGPLRIADLGCATGINTVSDVDFVVRTLTNLCGNGHGGALMPELQVYFSDLPCNDFNEFFDLLDWRGHVSPLLGGLGRI